VDFQLDDRQRELRDLARAFAREEVRPAAGPLDREPDPIEAFPHKLVRRASELGLRTLGIPERHGGAGADTLTQAVVLEELCAGDVGFGMALHHAWREGAALACLTTAEQRERFLPEFLADDGYLTSLAVTEPHAGTDNAIGYADTLEAGVRTTAELVGDEWVINGRKRFITNAGVSRLILLVARTDSTVPWTSGISVFLVPADAPGLRIGRAEDKLGLRLNRNAELVFEDCRIPRDNLLGAPDEGLALLQRMLRGSKAKEGAKCMGIAQAAYEEAIAFTRDRVQGGRPIVEHGSVAAVLGEIGMEIETARTLVWRAAWAVDHDPAGADPLETAVKVVTGEVAARCAVRSLELCGSYGIVRDNPVEKLVRDAVSMLHAGAGNHALRTEFAHRYAHPRPRTETPLLGL
jgi:alkylation response protein AidB-like acyl-CoA dehydrogenase